MTAHHMAIGNGATARIYKVRGGPYNGRWFYAQVDEQGRPWNNRDAADIRGGGGGRYSRLVKGRTAG